MSEEDTIVDSNLTREEALQGSAAPQDILDVMQLVGVEYISFDRKKHRGQIMVHKDHAEEVAEIFEQLLALQFPIEKVIPVGLYEWDDDKSMLDNNSSAFNYRHVAGKTNLSHHSYGCAIDINPFINPYFRDNKTWPEGATYNHGAMGVITANDEVVTTFEKYGWEWGGYWATAKDFQHFEKPVTQNNRE